MTKTPCLLFLFGSQVLRVVPGQPPYSTLSENTHLFVIANEALRLGWHVFFKMAGHDECPEIKQLYPTVHYDSSVIFDDENFQPDMMFCVNYPNIFSNFRAKKKNCIGVYILNAHFWLEGPEAFGINMVEFWRKSFGNDIDFILTQNPRMADISYKLFNITCKWSWPDRVLIAPNTYTPEALHEENACFTRAEVRREMELADNDIAIINSGGPWTWTDAATFFQAFPEAVRQGATRLKFFQMGLRQTNNISQLPAEEMVRMFMLQNFDLVESNHIIVEDDWAQASAKLPKYNYGADIGLNVSKESTENYQAHRVRFIDYAKANLPVLQTWGSYYGDVPAHKAVIPVEPGNVESYVEALLKINNGEIDLAAKRNAMHAFAESIVSSKVIPDALHTMLRMGRLPDAEREALRQQLYGLYHAINIDHFEDHFTPKDPAVIEAMAFQFKKEKFKYEALLAAREMRKLGYGFPDKLPEISAATTAGT